MPTDQSEQLRRGMVAAINANPGEREQLEQKHGDVYNTKELQEHFEVLGFMAPFIAVRRKSDGAMGSLEFQHDPRYYYRFTKD